MAYQHTSTPLSATKRSSSRRAIAQAGAEVALAVARAAPSA
jgi:hypothetical protein